MLKIKACTLIILLFFFLDISSTLGANTVGEAADVIAKAIDGKSLEELENGNLQEALTALLYMNTVKNLRHSYFEEQKAKTLKSPLKLFKKASTVGQGADVLANLIDHKGLDDLLNSKDIRQVLIGYNYLTRVGNINVIDKQENGEEVFELLKLPLFNGEITQKHIWIVHNVESETAVKIDESNYKDIKISINNKDYIFQKNNDVFEKIEVK